MKNHQTRPTPRPRMLVNLAIASAFLCSTLAATAQSSGGNQQVIQSVIAGGGGTSSSGSTQLDGTIGQSVTAISTSGAFTLSGGFWPDGAAVAQTALSAADTRGTYGGTVMLSARLTAGGANVSGQLITFSLNGAPVGTATTGTDGVAALNNVSLSGLGAGIYPGAVAASFGGDANLAAGSGSGQLTVQKADPLLQVVGGTVTYDGQPHQAAVSATGVNNEELSPVSVLYNQSGSAPVNAGTYAVAAQFAGNQNYNPVTNSGQNIVITRADQFITFGALAEKTYGDAPFTVSAAASSGLAVNLEVLSGPASLSGNTVIITGAGTVMLRASQAGDSNHNAATSVNQSFVVSKAAATITLANLSQTYDGTAKSPAVATSPADLKVGLSYRQNDAPVALPTNAGSYSVTATISDTNYQGTATGTLDIGKAVPVISWQTPPHITYGTALGGAQLNATADVPGTFIYNPPAGTVPGVGSNQLSVTFTPTDAANYSTATQSVLITVDPQSFSEISLGQTAYSVGEAEGHVTIIVNRGGDVTTPATVSYATADTAGLQPCSVFNGAASQRCDYGTVVGTLSFAPGETSGTITVPLIDDSYAEGPESFTIALSDAKGGTLGAASTATITITDNETANGSNPIADPAFFIRQQYIDFLGREPDPVGYQGWQDILNHCAAGDTSCDRISVSSGFFRSPEFQERGYFIYRFYAAALGRKPFYAEFTPDMRRVSGFLNDAQLEARKTAFVDEFMTRTEYLSHYGALTDNVAYVDALLQAAGLANHPLRGKWISLMNNGAATRAQVLRDLIESQEVYDKFYNEAFVVMQYFGYLRRDPDALYTQWIETMNRTGDYRAMISGFINSNEYVQRFGP